MSRSAFSRPFVGILAVLALLTATRLAAAELRLELDPAGTEITFELGATLHEVEGTAELREGRVAFDPESGTASGRIVVAAASLNTDHEGRDRKMHGQVLESTSFPEIVFSPRSVRGTFHAEGESTLVLDGTFTIHGDSHPLSLEVVVRRQGDRLSLETEFVVPYVSWGMSDPSRFVMRAAKEVSVRVEGAGDLVRVDSTADEVDG